MIPALARAEWRGAKPWVASGLAALLAAGVSGGAAQAATVRIGIVGHATSACSLAAAPVYLDNGVVQVNPTATNPQITEQGFWNVLRVCGRDDQQGKVAAHFVAAKGLKRIAILHDKGAYGQGLADAFRDALKRDHRIEPAFYGGITQGDKDFSAILTSVRAAGPEVLHFGGIYPEAGLVTKQARALGITARVMSGDGTIDAEFVKIAGKEAAEGSWLTFAPDMRNIPAAKGAIEAYEKQYGPIGPYSIYSYVAAKILFEGVKAVGARGPKDAQRVAEHIRKTPHETALGRIQFDAKGDVGSRTYVVYETGDGKFVQITGIEKQAAK